MLRRRPTVVLNTLAEDATRLPGLGGRLAALGFDGVGVADSPRLFADCFVGTEKVLAGSDIGLAGPCVANLTLRHPAVVAAGMRALTGERAGRTFLVVGKGESAVRNESVAPPRLAAYREQTRALTDALDEGIPVFGACSGPKTIAASATDLGGVLLDVGIAPDAVARAVSVAGTARKWMFLRLFPETSATAVAGAIRPVLGSCLARLVAAPEWYGLSSAELALARRSLTGRDYRTHGLARQRAGDADDGEAIALVRKSFVLAGERAAVAARLREFAALGIDGFVLAGGLAGVNDRLAELAGVFDEAFVEAGS